MSACITCLGETKPGEDYCYFCLGEKMPTAWDELMENGIPTYMNPITITPGPYQVATTLTIPAGTYVVADTTWPYVVSGTWPDNTSFITFNSTTTNGTIKG